MTAPNYDLIAKYYDGLSGLVFGDRMEQAKRAHLHLVKGKQKVLIVGGGTGREIEYIAQIDNKIILEYVDSSSKMLNLAKNRAVGSLQVKYYLKPILDIKDKGYDVVIVNFFLDQFSNQETTTIIKHLKHRLVSGGLILFSDLRRTSIVRLRLLDRIMFFAFRLLTGAKTVDYPQYHNIFKSLGFNRTSRIEVGRNIEAVVYSTN